MGGERIFLKTFRASLFNEELSNEPNFGQIHLAGLDSTFNHGYKKMHSFFHTAQNEVRLLLFMSFKKLR
jgi:hypothetical protein